MGKKLIVRGADFSANGIAPEYTRLNWVMSRNENQWFNLGFVRTLKMQLEVTFAVTTDLLESTDANRYYYVCGVEFPDRTNILAIACNQNKRVYASYIASKANSTPSHLINDTLTHTASIDGSKLVLDGVIVESIVEDSPLHTFTESIYAMGANVYGDTVGANMVHFSRLKVYSDYTDKENTLIHDFVPVIKLDGTVCLLDRISGDFIYTNDGFNPIYG